MSPPDSALVRKVPLLHGDHLGLEGDAPTGGDSARVSPGAARSRAGAWVSPWCPGVPAVPRCPRGAQLLSADVGPRPGSRIECRARSRRSGRRPGCPASTQPLHSWQKIAPRGVVQPGKAPSSPGQPMFIQRGGRAALPLPAGPACRLRARAAVLGRGSPGPPLAKTHRPGRRGVGRGGGKPLKSTGFVSGRSSPR